MPDGTQSPFSGSEKDMGLLPRRLGGRTSRTDLAGLGGRLCRVWAWLACR